MNQHVVKDRGRGKLAILETAEQLFAERGIDNVSLRTINTEAGYSVATLHYHFGSRDGLIDALLLLRVEPLLRHRQSLLDALDTDLQPTLRGIVEALVVPMAEPILQNNTRGLYTLKFLFQVYLDRSRRESVERIREHSYEVFDRLLSRVLPTMSMALRRQRWVIAAELTFQGLARIEQVADAGDYPLYLHRLIDFITGGLGAPETIKSVLL